MKNQMRMIWLAGLVLASFALLAQAEQSVRKLPLRVFRDKMQGAWLGQMIGVGCGQDSDCNPANAGGVFFAVLGASKIPSRFIEKLDLNAKYSHTDYTVPKVYEVSEMLVRKAVVRSGGRIEKDASGEEVFVIPVQPPQPGPIANSKSISRDQKEQMGQTVSGQLRR